MGQAIGIDFGTTNTVVSYKNKRGNFRQLKYKNEVLIPSVIFFRTRDDYVIGYPAKNQLVSNSAACVQNFKSNLGETRFTYEITATNGDKFKLTPKKAVKLFLNKVIMEVENKLIKDFGVDEGIIDRVVITVPAKFNPKEIEAIKSAAGDALNIGSENIRAVYEPTAAAVAALQYDDDAEKILIYDLGGGTFDVSLIQREKNTGTFKPIIPADGDKHLGGNLFTEFLAKWLMDKADREYDTDFTLDIEDFNKESCAISREHYRDNIAAVRESANEAKERLSAEDEVPVTFSFYTSGENYEDAVFTVTRRDFEKLIKRKVIETTEIAYRNLHAPEVEALNGVDKIVLAGGSSIIPLIKEMLSDKLECDVECDDEVSTLISRGAAILAQNISSIETLSQVTNFQIGIAAAEGMQLNKFQMIIPENISLPYTGTKDFQLADDGQRGLDIAYYEYDVKKYPNKKYTDEEGFQEIDVLKIDLPPGLKKNDTIVRVTFKANVDGSLDLSANIFDKDGNKIQDGSLTVKKESDLM